MIVNLLINLSLHQASSIIFLLLFQLIQINRKIPTLINQPILQSILNRFIFSSALTMKKLLVLLGVLSLTLAQDDIFKLVLLSQDRGAACLDGSPPAIYVHEGQGENKNNYLLYFEGGGFCGAPTLQGTLESCYSRSNSDLGSSKKYAKQLSGKDMGILSPLQSQNPSFYDWTIIVGKYCDGSEYVGHREVPIEFKDKKLYFRGSKNMKQIFHYLDEKYDFYNGGKIMIGGGSAGGICAFEWVNYLADNTKKAQVLANPDSGFFITDYETPIYHAKILRAYTEPLMTLVSNLTETPEPILKCLENPSFDVIDCMNVANYAKYIKVPFFMIQSPYDQFSIANIVGTRCYSNRQPPYSLQNCNTTDRAAIEDYRTKSIEYLKSMRNGRKDVGIWGPACVQHGFQHEPFSYNNQKFQVEGLTLMKALELFLKNPTDAPWLLDERVWPGNAGCSGLAGSLRSE